MNDLHHRFRFEALPTRGTAGFVMQQTPQIARHWPFVASQTGPILKMDDDGGASARHFTGPIRRYPGTKKGGYGRPEPGLLVTYLSLLGFASLQLLAPLLTHSPLPAPSKRTSQ
jgi:hypothetical protein